MTNVRLIIMLLAGVLILGMVAPAAAQAQIVQVTLGIDGMVWPVWAYGARKALSRLEGVDKVEVSLEDAMGTMTLKEGAALKPELMRKAIKDTGFTLTWMKVRARGMVTEHEGSSAFKVDGSGQVFPLLDNDVLKNLRAAPGLEGKEILVTGSVEGSEPVALRLESFEVEWRRSSMKEKTGYVNKGAKSLWVGALSVAASLLPNVWWTLPLVFAAFGVTSGGLGAVSLAAYRVYLLPVSVLSIGVAFYLSYTKGMGGPKRRRFLWGALAVSLFFWVAPWLQLWIIV